MPPLKRTPREIRCEQERIEHTPWRDNFDAILVRREFSLGFHLQDRHNASSMFRLKKPMTKICKKMKRQMFGRDIFQTVLSLCFISAGAEQPHRRAAAGSAKSRCRDKKAGTHRMFRTCGRPDPCTAFASSGETAGYSSSVSV